MLKPARWALSPALVGPEWAWFWKDALMISNVHRDGVLRDLTKNVDGVLNNFSANPWIATEDGTGLDFDTTNDYVRFSGLGSQLGTTSPWTVMIRARLNESPALLNLFNLNNGSTNIVIGYWWSSGNGFLLQRGNVGAARATELISDPDITILHTWVFRWDGVSNQPEIFVDGKDLSTGGTSGLSAVNADTLDLNRGASGGYQAASTVTTCGLWSRKWTDAEILHHSRDPFGPFRMADDYAVWKADVGPPAAAILNQLQGANLGADLFNGTMQ